MSDDVGGRQYGSEEGAVSRVTVVEVPQWQGSGSATAERLREGARLLAGMVDADRRLRVEVADDLPATARNVRAALDQAGDGGLVVAVGGDCGVELEPVAAARRRHGDRLVVVWFDAHGDLNTPGSSPSGAYHGMVLRALTGEGPDGLVPDVPLAPGRVVLAGVRDLDPAEVAFVRSHGVRHVREADAEALVAAIEAAADGGEPRRSAAEPAVYVHVDFDVLDPGVFGSVGCPTPAGLRPDELLSLVKAVAGRFEVAGLGLMEYEPGRPEDQELLTPLVKALVAACR
ncbi:arginase family protein [Nonomuraea pusilla]|uniref:Arginase n=1 Tax=Nonomuraea pusilla TaxID=46177 RepID=A0A1H7GD97_9ACTN|nr:arginase family protein [Nonomuraea pusilla]SEK36091.1 arginase [Nonomuraea pusilla]